MNGYLGNSGQPDHDAMGVYMASIRPAFDSLIGVASQLSAILVATTAVSSAAPLPALLAGARAFQDEAIEVLQTTGVPAGGEHHHHHLKQAAALIGLALAHARPNLSKSNNELDRVMNPLREGWNELNAASKALPGLSVLNMGECCGAHVRRRPMATANKWQER